MKKGFTLIELLVVVAIIAILSMVGMAAYGNVQKNARDAKRRGDIHTIRNALDAYYMDNKSYPATNKLSNDVDPDVWTDAVGGSTYYASGKAPVDPINNTDYYYRYYVSGLVCIYLEVPPHHHSCLSRTQ